MNRQSESGSRDTTFDNIGVPKTGWLSVRNICTKKPESLEIILEVNGVEKVIQDYWIPGLSPSEGIVLYSSNLTWLFQIQQQRIDELEGLLREACDAVECSDDFLAGAKHKEEFLNKPEIKKLRGEDE